MIRRLGAGLASRWRTIWFRSLGASITGLCSLRNIEIPRNHFDISLSRGVSLDRGVTLLATGDRLATPRIMIGASTYINRNTMIDASEKIKIGDDCMIGPCCYITDHDHGIHRDTLIRDQPLNSAPVTIEDGSWIGAHVTILKGVRIGRGAVVGAGAVVTKDVSELSIVAGIPAKHIGDR